MLKKKQNWDGAALSDFCYPVKLRTIYMPEVMQALNCWASQEHPHFITLPDKAPENLVCWAPYDRVDPAELLNLNGINN